MCGEGRKAGCKGSNTDAHIHPSRLEEEHGVRISGERNTTDSNDGYRHHVPGLPRYRRSDESCVSLALFYIYR